MLGIAVWCWIALNFYNGWLLSLFFLHFFDSLLNDFSFQSDGQITTDISSSCVRVFWSAVCSLLIEAEASRKFNIRKITVLGPSTWRRRGKELVSFVLSSLNPFSFISLSRILVCDLFMTCGHLELQAIEKAIKIGFSSGSPSKIH